jgi:GDP-L-fucose synthase
MKNYSGEIFLNVGTGKDITILELAQTLARVIGWHGSLTFNTSKPDGMPRKVMDISRLSSLGWSAKTDFESGLLQAYEWYLAKAV